MMQYRAMMFSWAPLLVMGPGKVYRLYPPLGGPVHCYANSPQRRLKPSPVGLLTAPTHKGRPGWVTWMNTGMVDPPKVVTNASTKVTRLDAASLCWCDQRS